MMESKTAQPEKRSPTLLARMRRFLADRRGAGAVEFALIAPILLSLYITSFEITMGLSASKRVTRTASTIADLVTRETEVSDSWLEEMDDVLASLFAPYTAQEPNIRITGVTLDAGGNAKVAWSWDGGNAPPYAVGSPVEVPTEMRVPGTFLVRSQVSVQHDLLMFMSGVLPTELRTITIGREFFYRQRVGNGITCKDCS